MAILSIHSRCILHENQSIFSREKQNEFTVLKLNNFFFLSVQSFLLLSFGASVVVIVPEFIFPLSLIEIFHVARMVVSSFQREKKKKKQTNKPHPTAEKSCEDCIKSRNVGNVKTKKGKK